MMKKYEVKTKKAVLCGLIFLLFMTGMSVSAGATEEPIWDYVQQGGETAGISDIEKSLDGQTAECLKNFGIDSENLKSIFEISPKAVLSVVVDLVKKNSRAPVKFSGTVAGVLFLCALARSFSGANENSAVGAVGAATVAVAAFSPLYQAIKGGISVIGAAAKLELALIPAFAGTVTAAGDPSLALSYSTLALGAAQLIAVLAENTVVPLVGVCLALGLAGMIAPQLQLVSLWEQILKWLRTLLGVGAGLFSSLLSLKAVLARSTDGLLSKGIKLAVSSFVPVVGGALSEAYSTVAGSLSLLSAAVGGFGIGAVFALCVPVIITLLLWHFALKAGEMTAGMLGLKTESGVLKMLAAVVSLINILVVYTMAIFIISAGIVLAVRTEK